MGLKEAIQNVWASDYVQKNPNKAYKVSYAAEYAKVADFLNGGPEPTPWSGFSKLGKGLVEAEIERRKAENPTPPDPIPPDPILPFAEAALTNPVTPSVTSTSFNCESGKDYLIDFGMVPRQSFQLNGSPRNVKMRNLYTRDGFKMYATATGHVSLTNWFVEGSPTTGDILAIACKPVTKFTVQNFRWETPADSNNQSGHLDLVQVQGAIGRLEFAVGTGYVTGVRPPNQGGKGMQLDILDALGEIGGPFSVDMRDVNLVCQGTPATGARSGPVVIGKDDNAQIQMFLKNVWIANAPAFDLNAVTNYPANLQKTLTGSAPNRVMTFPGNTQGWSGDVHEGVPASGDIVLKSDLGL